MKTGTASLPLHWGKAPPWLFIRMKRLGREIMRIIIRDFGTRELLQRLSDPYWFQALGCVLGFDWHSSGLTTTVCGALKEGIRDMDRETGFFIAGGKGRASRSTPAEIAGQGPALGVNPGELIYASRMSAKVDSAGIQDGYQLYHHVFFYTAEGDWAVVQQGLNYETRYARRYHWLGSAVDDFVCEPHAAVCCDARAEALNLVAREGAGNRTAAAAVAGEHPDRIMKEASTIAACDLPGRHRVLKEDISAKRIRSILITTYEQQPENFEALMSIQGVGPKTLRSLSLLAELIYGTPPSYRDPVRYSYAHGGKDGHPYPVNRDVYDASIRFLKETVNECRIGNTDKQQAFRRLSMLDTKLPSR